MLCSQSLTWSVLFVNTKASFTAFLRTSTLSHTNSAFAGVSHDSYRAKRHAERDICNSLLLAVSVVPAMVKRVGHRPLTMEDFLFRSWTYPCATKWHFERDCPRFFYVSISLLSQQFSVQCSPTYLWMVSYLRNWLSCWMTRIKVAEYKRAVVRSVTVLKKLRLVPRSAVGEKFETF